VTTYSYAQLEGLWEQAGGSATVAPTAAAIAEAESGGNPDAAYPGRTIAPGTGSTTDATGLWQILGLPAGNFTAGELTNPLDNAEMAVAKYTQAGNSFTPWQTYDTGAYQQYLQGGVAADVADTSGTSQLAQGSGCPSFDLFSPSSWFSSTECNAAEGFTDWILQSLGLTDLSELLERGALILLGVMFLFIGVIKLTSGDSSSKEKLQIITPAGTTAEETGSAEAAEIAAV
jgi:Lysozyme like domain